MKKLVRAIVRIPAQLLIGVVRAYQLVISPHLAPSCRYVPTCSEYAIQAIRQFGVVKGVVLAVNRIARCHPWGGSGYDPPRWFGDPPQDERAGENPLRDELKHTRSPRNDGPSDALYAVDAPHNLPNQSESEEPR